MAKKAVIQAVVAGAIAVFGIVFFMTHYVIINNTAIRLYLEYGGSEELYSGYDEVKPLLKRFPVYRKSYIDRLNVLRINISTDRNYETGTVDISETDKFKSLGLISIIIKRSMTDCECSKRK